MAVKPIPDNYPRVSAYLIVEGANDAIEFYKKVLGAEERMRMGGPDGRVGHAELRFGDSLVMLADAYPEMDIRDPKTIGGYTRIDDDLRRGRGQDLHRRAANLRTSDTAWPCWLR